jgi:hypothetical protein
MDGEAYFVEACFTLEEAEYAADRLTKYNGRVAIVVLADREDDVWGNYIYSTEEYTDNDDMRVHAPRDDQMDTYANKED